MLNLISTLRKTAAITALILFGVSGAAADPADVPAAGTYTWSAELVAFDEATRMATLQNSLVGYPAQDLSGYDDGDRIMLSWSGVVYASRIRAITHAETAGGRFEIPVEFAAVDGHDLSFRLPVPADYVHKVKAIEPGTWVTATSAYGVRNHDAVVMHMRRFTDTGERYEARVTRDVTAPETYTWSAELVALDEAEAMATVRARLVEHGRVDPGGFGAGDPIMLTWSGVDSAAAGILAVVPGETAWWGRFEMPVEFVSLEGRYLTFRTPIQAELVDTIRALDPGEWVTATSPHAAWDRHAVVMDIRGFTDIGGWSGGDLADANTARPRSVLQSTQLVDIESFNDIG